MSDAIAGEVVDILKRNEMTITLAESCTGGMLASMIVSLSGASSVMNEAHVTYSNDAKTRVLGVPSSDIETYGAVSSNVAIAMAEGARNIASADYAIAITGIAGPNGGTEDKPVGTVWVAIATREYTQTKLLTLDGDRNSVRYKACVNALRLLKEILDKRVGAPSGR